MFFLLLAHISGLAFASGTQPRFHYETRIPAGTLDCSTEAKLMRDRFEQATSNTSAEAICSSTEAFEEQGKRYEIYSISLSYSASHPLNPYIAYFGAGETGSVFPNPYNGLYDTYADCIKAVDTQIAAYETETGLRVVSAGCDPGPFGSTPNYILKIEGFANAEEAYRSARRHLYALEFKPFGQGVDSLIPEVGEMIIDQGGEQVQRIKETFLYYSPFEVRVFSDLLASLSTREECLSQVQQAQSIGAALGSKKVYARCYPLSDADFQGTTFLEITRGGGSFLTNNPAPRRYFSFQACMNGYAAVVKDSGAIGGICHPDEYHRLYILELFGRI